MQGGAPTYLPMWGGHAPQDVYPPASMGPAHLGHPLASHGGPTAHMMDWGQHRLPPGTNSLPMAMNGLQHRPSEATLNGSRQMVQLGAHNRQAQATLADRVFSPAVDVNKMFDLNSLKGIHNANSSMDLLPTNLSENISSSSSMFNFSPGSKDTSSAAPLQWNSAFSVQSSGFDGRREGVSQCYLATSHAPPALTSTAAMHGNVISYYSQSRDRQAYSSTSSLPINRASLEAARILEESHHSDMVLRHQQESQSLHQQLPFSNISNTSRQHVSHYPQAKHSGLSHRDVFSIPQLPPKPHAQSLFEPPGDTRPENVFQVKSGTDSQHADFWSQFGLPPPNVEVTGQNPFDAVNSDLQHHLKTIEDDHQRPQKKQKLQNTNEKQTSDQSSAFSAFDQKSKSPKSDNRRGIFVPNPEIDAIVESKVNEIMSAVKQKGQPIHAEIIEQHSKKSFHGPNDVKRKQHDETKPLGYDIGTLHGNSESRSIESKEQMLDPYQFELDLKTNFIPNSEMFNMHKPNGNAVKTNVGESQAQNSDKAYLNTPKNSQNGTKPYDPYRFDGVVDMDPQQRLSQQVMDMRANKREMVSEAGRINNQTRPEQRSRDGNMSVNHSIDAMIGNGPASHKRASGMPLSEIDALQQQVSEVRRVKQDHGRKSPCCGNCAQRGLRFSENCTSHLKPRQSNGQVDHKSQNPTMLSSGTNSKSQQRYETSMPPAYMNGQFSHKPSHDPYKDTHQKDPFQFPDDQVDIKPVCKPYRFLNSAIKQDKIDQFAKAYSYHDKPMSHGMMKPQFSDKYKQFLSMTMKENFNSNGLKKGLIKTPKMNKIKTEKAGIQHLPKKNIGIKSSNALLKRSRLHGAKLPGVRQKWRNNVKYVQRQKDDTEFAKKLLKNLGYKPLSLQDLVTKSKKLTLPKTYFSGRTTIASSVLSSENKSSCRDRVSPNVPDVKDSPSGEPRPQDAGVGNAKAHVFRPFESPIKLQRSRSVENRSPKISPLKRSRSNSIETGSPQKRPSDTRLTMPGVAMPQPLGAAGAGSMGGLAAQISHLQERVAGGKTNLEQNLVEEVPQCSCYPPGGELGLMLINTGTIMECFLLDDLKK